MNIQNLITDMKSYDDRILFMSDNQNLSYLDVLNSSLELSYYFDSIGIKKGDYIVINTSTSIETFIIFYASQLLGAIFVPLHTNWSEKMIKKIISKLPNYIYISDTSLDIDTISIEKIKHIINNKNFPSIEFPKISSTDTSTILFSSGTTGEPKGVVLSHETLYKKAKLFTKSYSWKESDIVLMLGEITSIDRLRTGAISPLFIGNSMVVYNKKKKFFFDIANTIREYSCTITSMTPTIVKQFNLYSKEVDKNSLKSLKFITVAGSFLSDDEEEKFQELFNKKILRYYGLTEIGGFCVATTPEDMTSSSNYTGRAIECEIKIIGDDGIEVPIGKRGELLIKSPIPFMKGYYNNLELTDKTIRAGWLHTNDLASLNKKKEVSIFGRMGDVFKNAYEELIYPFEIETIISKHSLVLECCVFDYQTKFGITGIASIIKPNRVIENKEEFFRTVKQLVSSELGTHKTPSFYRLIDEFPKTSSLKIQKHKVKSIFFDENGYVK